MKTKFIIPIILITALLAFLPGCKKSGSAGQKYHCPMHPTYISDRPGDCPICGMKLVLIKEGGVSAAKTAATRPYLPKAGDYFCTMKCEGSITNQPGNCPVCGMKLELADEARARAFAVEAAAEAERKPVPGRVMVALAPEKRQMIGLRTSKVERRELTVNVRTTAVVEHDETRFSRVAPRFNGWVKDLKVNYTGQVVAQGDVLFSAYSPDLLAGENEYLLAVRNYRQALTNSVPALQIETARRLMESARKRLVLWQIGDEDIRAIEDKQEVKDEMVFRAPLSGHVTVKNVVEGKAFMAGESLYEIADLHHLWLRASVFEVDFPRVKIGQKAVITFPYLVTTNLESEVSFIYPHIDPLTRRGEVRMELDNPGHALRPDMWANVEIQMPLGRLLTVPASAVIDTGARFVAFVDRADGHLEPREVKIGAKTDDYWETLEGVKEGENVVTRALFLVDSESQLKAAMAGMAGEPAAGVTNAVPAGHKH